MRKIISFVLVGIFLYGCSANEKASATKQEADSRMSALAQNKQKLLKAGMEYLNQGKIPEAIKTLNQAVLMDPRDASTSFVLAQTYLHLKRYESAAGVLDNVIKMEPDNGEAYYLKGVAGGLLGNREEAMEAAKKSVAIFQEKRDEKNFKRAIVLLQGLSSANNSQGLSRDEEMPRLYPQRPFPKDAVSSNISADSQMNDSDGQK